MKPRLENRVAIVTGGATGIGKAIAARLARDGAKVVVADLQKAAHGALNLQVDVSREDQVERMAAETMQALGRIDILVNNAGILSGRTPWHSLSREEVNRFLQVNFMGYFLTAKAMYPLLKKSKAGRVINVASRTFFLANPGQMAYVAAKGAVWGMTRVLAKELGDEGITVNAVAPGMIATPGTEAHSGEEAFERVMQNQAIKKRGKPEHLANLIAFLASDEADMITGQFMLADGGGYLH